MWPRCAVWVSHVLRACKKKDCHPSLYKYADSCGFRDLGGGAGASCLLLWEEEEEEEQQQQPQERRTTRLVSKLSFPVEAGSCYLFKNPAK